MKWRFIILLLLSTNALAALNTNTVGRVAGSGNGYTESGGTYTAYGSGSGLWTQTDGLTYFWRGLTGDGSIVARITDFGGSSNVLAGVMLRETLEYDARYVACFVKTNVTGSVSNCSLARDAYSTYSTLDPATNTWVSNATVVLPSWVKVERVGTTYIQSYSDDGATWITNGTATAMGATNCLYAGFFVLNQRDDSVATVTVDNVTITGSEPSEATFNAEIAGVLAGPRYSNPAPDAALTQINAQAQVFKTARLSNPGFFSSGKKLVCAALPTPRYLVTNFVPNLADAENRPFSGVVLCHGPGSLGAWVPNRPRAFDENRLIESYNSLTNFVSTKFTDNFLQWSPAELDWFSDQQWSATLSNTVMMAKSAELGRFAGIWLDGEGSGGPFNYKATPKGIGCWQYSWDDYCAKVRERGSNWIQSVESELPKAKILFTFLFPILGKTFNTNTLANDMVTSTYGLLPSFVSGMLLGSTNSGTQFIDGTEAAYAGATQWTALSDYTTRSNQFYAVLPTILIYSNALPAYTNKARFGLAVMPSRIYNTTPSDDEDYQFWKNSIYWTLSVSDRYVWDWHTTSASNLWTLAWADTTNNLPYKYVDGILDAEQLLNARTAQATTLRVGTLRGP